MKKKAVVVPDLDDMEGPGENEIHMNGESAMLEM